MQENQDKRLPATKAQFDYINTLRENNGEALLDIKDFNFDAPGDPVLTDEEKQAAADKLASDKLTSDKLAADNLEAQKLKEKEEQEKLEGEELIKITNKKEKATVPTVVVEADLEDDAVLKAFNKKFGKNFTSLDQVYKEPEAVALTQEEINKAKEQRESDKVAFGLKNGLVKSKEYESFIQDTANPTELVFQQYFADQSKEDDTLTEEKAREEFEEKFNLTLDKTSRQYKRGVKEISVMAGNLISSKYPSILSLEEKYSAQEKTTKEAEQEIALIASKKPEFISVVKAAISDVRMGEVDLGEMGKYRYEIGADILDEYEKNLLDDKNVSRSIKKGYTKQGIIDTLRGAAITTNFQELVGSIVSQALLKNQKGLKGVEAKRPFTPRKVDNQIQKESLKALHASLDIQN